jgi:agmatinase
MTEDVPFNFLGLPPEYCNYQDSKIVVLPVPFDKTSSWIKGSDKGPYAIIDASRNVELYDIETNSEIYKLGIFTSDDVLANTSKEMIELVSDMVSVFLEDGKFVVTLGGEHTVSIAPIKAYSDRFEDLSVLHLDAHSDMRDEYLGDPYSHASAMSRVAEFVDNIISVGIRSMDSCELPRIDRSRMFFAHRIVNSDEWMDEVVEKLSDNVYISIDLDVFDPSIMPSTGTPEPGGLDWYKVIRLMDKVAQKKRVVGFDVVELCPSSYKASDFLASKLVYRILSSIFHEKSKSII